MLQSSDSQKVTSMRTGPKDIGVALVVLVALALGLLLRTQTEGQTRTFQEPDGPFRVTYPATWSVADSLQDVLLKVADPRTDSVFKTTLTVESRELDPTVPPELQALIDRRVEQRSQQTGYHFLSDNQITVDGAPSAVIEYAYTVQPIDTPRRASLPVVVQAREYIIVARERLYYITLLAPANAFDSASAQLDRIIQTVQIQ